MENIERKLTLDYILDDRFIILNPFVTYMRLNYDLSYTNKRAVDMLLELGLTRKRISFDTYKGIKQSKNEFINIDGANTTKPIIGKLITHDNSLTVVASKVLTYIKAQFLRSNFAMGIISFNIFNSDEGLILLFDNKSLKEILSRIQDEFTYDEKTLIQVATKIRNMSETSFVRENSYTETSRHVADKKFYKYIYEIEGE